MPSQRYLDFEEVVRRFELQEGSPELPDDTNHEEEEMALDDFQKEKSAYVLIRDGDIFTFPFEDEDSLDHFTQEETNPVYNEPSNNEKEMFVQELLRAAEETEDLELSLELLMQATNLQYKCEADVKVGHIEI
ncbi:hypothetical protein KI387_031085, partial [Taxus chinensis]